MLAPTIVVVGAGPAGSTAARLLAASGGHVVLLEARRLPRDKSCAGVLTPKALRWLPASVAATGERSVHSFEFRGGRSRPLRMEAPAAELLMVERARFDSAMAEAASAAGVDVRDGQRVIRVREHERGVTVTTRGGTIEADFLVAGDGDPSTVARDLGIGSDAPRRSLALHARVPLSTAAPSDTAIISFSAPRGYVWYFPKRDQASIGVGSVVPAGDRTHVVAQMRRSLAALADQLEMDLSDAPLRGHWLPQGIRRSRLVSRRSLLVGDAAGMADPLLGEGIAHAIVSGVMAAQVLHDMAAGASADLRPYEERLRGVYGPAMRRLHAAAAIVERSPTLALTVARLSRWVQAYGVNVVAGQRAPFSFDALAAASATPPSRT